MYTLVLLGYQELEEPLDNVEWLVGFLIRLECQVE